MTDPSSRKVRRAVYRLKRRKPQALTLCRTTGNVTDFATGQQYEALVTVNVARAVVLPAKALRRFMHAPMDTSTNQDFAMGGMFDARTRGILLSRRDIPSTFPIDLNMHLIFKAKRWEVKALEEFENDEAIILLVQSVDGSIVDVSNPPDPPATPTPVPPLAQTFTYEVDFQFDSTSPINFGIFSNGDTITSTEVEITTAFNDPAAIVTVGLVSNPGGILASSDVDPTTVGTYANSGNIDVTSGTEQVRLQIVPGASARGAGRVLLTVVRG